MIELKDLKIVKGNKIILENFNLKINDGDFIAITGKTGCGKSSLLNVISLLEQPESGSISVFNNTNIKFNSRQGQWILKEKYGLIFQDNFLIDNESIYDNLKIALDPEGFMTIDQALEFTELNMKKDRMVYTLSGGEQQRLALCRVLVSKFDVIIGDEITANLDPETRDKIIDLLIQINQSNKTIILVTHDPKVSQRASRTINL